MALQSMFAHSLLSNDVSISSGLTNQVQSLCSSDAAMRFHSDTRGKAAPLADIVQTGSSETTSSSQGGRSLLRLRLGPQYLPLPWPLVQAHQAILASACQQFAMCFLLPPPDHCLCLQHFFRPDHAADPAPSLD